MRKHHVPWWGWLIVIAVLLACYALVGWVFTLLWNWLAVEVFGAPVISFWQALGILLLLSIVGRMIAPRRNRD